MGKYYDLASKCDVGRGRTLGVAIAVHLMMDLPRTLYAIGSTPDQREDFIAFGDILLEIFPDLITDIATDYRTDIVRELLRGFFIGDWVDRFTQEGTMTEFMYQGIRMKAWRDGQNFRHFPEWAVELEMKSVGALQKFYWHILMPLTFFEGIAVSYRSPDLGFTIVARAPKIPEEISCDGLEKSLDNDRV